MNHVTASELVALAQSSPRKRALTLVNCDLTEVPDALDAFTLHRLSIATNQLATFPPQLRRQGKLRTLEIESNPIAALPDWLGELAALKTLKVERCALSAVDLPRLPRLEELSLDFNPIVHLTLPELPALARFSIHLHQLTALPAVLSELPLTDLHAAYGPLEALPELPSGLTSLSVGNTRLTALPESLAGCRSLEMLHASDNAFERLPAVDFPELVSVFLSGCGLSEVPALVLRAPKLWVLRMAGNPQLTALPDAITALPMRVLDLSGTGLTAIPPQVQAMPLLKTLELQGAPLKSWPDFPPPPSLRDLRISRTPLEARTPPPDWAHLVR